MAGPAAASHRRGDRKAKVYRLYAELLCLFCRFFESRDVSEPLKDAGVAVLVPQVFLIPLVVRLAEGLGLLVGPDSRTPAMWTLFAALVVLNWLILRNGGDLRLVESVADSRCVLAKIVVGTEIGVLLSIVAYKALV